jgi:hypothetical protein
MVNKYMILLGLSCFLGLYSCAIKGYGPTNMSSRHETQTLKNYEVGSELAAYVGDSMIEAGSLNVARAKTVLFKSLIDLDQTGFMRSGYHPLKKDQLYPVTGFNPSDNSFLVFLGTKCVLGDCLSFYAKVDSEGRIISRKVVNKSGLYQQNPVYFEGYNEGDKLFEKVELTDDKVLDNSFKMQLIYNGREGSNIKILYREFQNDLARPAFYQSLTYDVSNSNIIRYKNLKVEVLKADNERIVYRVLED